MSEIQTRVLDAIRQRISDAGFDPVVNTEWANTGTIQALAPGEFGAERIAHYQFNDAYCSFDGSNVIGTSVPGAGYVKYTDPANMNTLPERVADYLIGRR